MNTNRDIHPIFYSCRKTHLNVFVWKSHSSFKLVFLRSLPATGASAAMTVALWWPTGTNHTAKHSNHFIIVSTKVDHTLVSQINMDGVSMLRRLCPNAADKLTL